MTFPPNATKLGGKVKKKDQIELQTKKVELAKDKQDLLREQLEYEKAKYDFDRKRLRDKENDAGSGFLNRRYYFNECVDSDTVARCRRYILAWIDLDPTAPITIEFNSGGGSCFAGWDLFGVIREASKRGAHVTTIISGYAGSMAGILAQAGDTRQIREDSFFHMHEAANDPFYGKGSKHRDNVQLLDLLTRKAAETFARRGNKTADEFFEMMDRREVYLDANTALTLGLVDEVI